MRSEHHIKAHLVSLRYGDKMEFCIGAGPTYHRPTKAPKYGTPADFGGCRRPAELSPFNYRGTMVNDNNDRELTFESGVERNAGLILQTEPDIAELRSQWPKVAYIAADGSRHEHTFDFFARMKTGERVAIAAKPLSLLLKTDLIGTLLSIVDRGHGNFADKVSFVTEAYASDAAAWNAKMILNYRRARNEPEYEIARAMLQNIRGPVRFRALFAGATDNSARRAALWCLIDERRLRPIGAGYIHDHSMMLASV